MVHGPVREVVRGPSPLDWSTDQGSVFSGHPDRNVGLTLQGSFLNFQEHLLCIYRTCF